MGTDPPQRPDVSETDVFPDSFMQKHTDSDSLQEFFDESQWEIEGEDDLESVPDAEFDEYVAENTRFSDWEEMKAQAGAEWLSRNMQS